MFFCITVHSQDVDAAGTAGLNYQNYAAGGPVPGYTQDANGNITNRTLLSTGTVNTVGLTTSSGAGLPTRSDGFIVRFYGFINIPTSGTYYFGGQADDGIRIKINNISVVNSWQEDGGSFRQGSINLPAGTVPVEIMYYENGGGQMVNFQWLINGSWQFVPASSLSTNATYWAPAGPAVIGGTITQTNAPSNQGLTSGGGSSGPTTAETTRINNWRNTPQSVNNYLYIEQISGDFNSVTITQSGTKNTTYLGMAGAGSNTVNITQEGSAYLNGLVQGANNTFTSTQSNTSGNNYQETKIIGSGNSVITNQTGNASQLMFNTITGNNNTVNATQSGTSQHYLNTTLTGNGNSVLSDQSGNTANNASINLTNSGGAASVDLQQSGGKSFNLIQSCANPAGCSTVVRQ